MIHETGRLAVAGTSSLNIRLNQKLGEIDGVKELLINPASGDAGTAIGAAAFAALFRYKAGVMSVIGACALAGLAVTLLR